jgi:anti-sigma regulatory factor (Ser/Thr protein kinase)
MPHLYGTLMQGRHAIRETSAIGAVRRGAQRLAAEVGLDETSSGRAAIAATELATNVLRHGGGGEVLVQAIPGCAGTALEIIAIDRGPGMRNLQRCLRDGYSSGATLGTGLGAVTRLSDEFDIASVPDKGTVVMARIGGGSTGRFGAICTPREGETECGDTWRLARGDDQQSALIVIDGLGHGPSAAEAARAAARAFGSSPFDAPVTQLERVHRALTGTRGAAVACATWTAGESLRYAGVGNITGCLTGCDASRGLPSHNGTLGFQLQRVQQFEYPLANGNLVIMHSDGLSARWDLNEQFGLRNHHPAVIAATLYRDHGRARDDATVVVVSV